MLSLHPNLPNLVTVGSNRFDEFLGPRRRHCTNVGTVGTARWYCTLIRGLDRGRGSSTCVGPRVRRNPWHAKQVQHVFRAPRRTKRTAKRHRPRPRKLKLVVDTG